MRSVLPNRRFSLTYTVWWNGNPWAVSTSYFVNNTAAEVFVSGSKSGAELQAIARDGAILISLALQYGCPIEIMQHALTREQDGSPSTLLGLVVDGLEETP